VLVFKNFTSCRTHFLNYGYTSTSFPRHSDLILHVIYTSTSTMDFKGQMLHGTWKGCATVDTSGAGHSGKGIDPNRPRVGSLVAEFRLSSLAYMTDQCGVHGMFATNLDCTCGDTQLGNGRVPPTIYTLRCLETFRVYGSMDTEWIIRNI
jgi:hypothetical protein